VKSARMQTDEDKGTPDKYVETYYAGGAWHSRRHDSDIPFASGADELEQIALGTEVARWNQLPHVIRTSTGAIDEILPAS
jgi:hypothetical protein